MRFYAPFKQEVTLTRTNTGWASAELTDLLGRIGYLSRIAVRNPVGSNISSVRVLLVCDTSDSTAISAAPDELDAAYDSVTNIAIAGTSDTAIQFQEYFGAHARPFVLGLTQRKWYVAMNVATGAGANSLVVSVEGFILSAT